MDACPAPSPELTDPFGPMRHRWWLIAFTGVLGIAGAAGWLRHQEPVWESSTTLLVHPVELETSADAATPIDPDTEAQFVRSTAVAAAAAERLGGGSPEDLTARVAVAAPAAAVIEITFTAPRPDAARLGAAAFAEAYLTHREERAHAHRAARQQAVEDRIAALDDSVTELTERLAGTLPGTPAAADIERRRAALTDQRDALVEELHALSHSAVNAGAVISEAGRAQRLEDPPAPVVLASGAVLGLTVGGAAALFAQRLARRVRRPADLQRTGLPVLAALADLPPAASVVAATSPHGRVFDRLRNEVLAILDGAGQVIVVASTSRGSAAAPVAHHLAASLARFGEDVVLVGSGRPTTPALSDVLAGRAPLREALRRHPGTSGLRCLTLDQAAISGNGMQSAGVRRVLAALTRQAGYVVVEAPPTCVSAAAQTLANDADGVLLVVEAGRAQLAEVADAVTQLRRVRARTLGAVMVPPTPPSSSHTPWRGRAPAPLSNGHRPTTTVTAPRPTSRGGVDGLVPPRSPAPPRPPIVLTPAARQPNADDETVTLSRLTPSLIRAYRREHKPLPRTDRAEARRPEAPARDA